jgi:hypothetical protein
MRFGFVGPAYLFASPLVAAEQLINWRPIKAESPNARTQFALLPTSGLSLFATLKAGLPSVRGEWTGNGRAFCVAGTHLFELNALGGVADYGDNSVPNNNIEDDGLPATMVAGGTVGGVILGNAQAIKSATISSPTTAAIVVASVAGFQVNANAVIAGITNPLFAQLNGTWVVASIVGTTVNLTTSGLTVQPMTVLAAGTATPSSTAAGAYPSQLLICSGGNLTVFSLSQNAFQPMTTPPSENLMVDFMDGYFIALQANNTFSVSNPEDATTWPGLSISQVQVFSDQLLSIIAANRLLCVFGSKRAVFYYNSGAPLFPFDVVSGGFMEVGIVAQFSAARIATRQGTTILWLGGDERGQGVVYAANGFTPQRVSDSALEYWMSQQATISDAVGMARQEEGQNFYDLWFPSANATWTLDIDLGWWHRRSSLVNGIEAAHLQRSHMNAFGYHLVGDRTSGNVYRLSTNFPTDNGVPILRTRVGPTIENEGGQITVPINEFQVDFETGLGPIPPLTDGFGNPRDPYAMFSYSEDYGKTWTPERQIACGQGGNSKVVAIDRRLGSWRSWTPRVRVSDPIPWRIADAYVNGTQDQKQRLSKQLAAIS